MMRIRKDIEEKYEKILIKLLKSIRKHLHGPMKI